LAGQEPSDYLPLIPKLTLQYDLNPTDHFYASVTKGYQAGGFNVQLFSDLIQTQLQAEMTGGMKTSLAAQFQPYVAMGMPQSAVDAILNRMPVSQSVKDIRSAIAYNPEYSWNYEVGFHLEPFKQQLILDGALFYMDVKDRQIVQFAPNGYGRMMKNAGASVSKGFELTASAKPIRDLGLQVAYGLTDARFTRYVDSVRVNGTYQQVNYKGKKVAMVPQNPLSVGADYWIGLKSRCLDGVRLSAQYTGAGPIYFTEANDRKQDFYGLMDGQIAFNKHNRSLILWIRNGFNEVYNTFYFESMGKAFIQRGAPRQLGITLRSSF